MTDYIRKAVELVDSDRYPWDYYKMTNVDPPHEQFMLDALAAQLVRQVDATDYGIIFNTDNECKTAVWGSRGYTPYVISSSFGPDRTLNTIKAIVDSGVLVQGEQKQ